MIWKLQLTLRKGDSTAAVAGIHNYLNCFEQLEKIMKANDPMDKPAQLYTMDEETGMPLKHTAPNIVAKHVHNTLKHRWYACDMMCRIAVSSVEHQQVERVSFGC